MDGGKIATKTTVSFEPTNCDKPHFEKERKQKTVFSEIESNSGGFAGATDRKVDAVCGSSADGYYFTQKLVEKI